MVWGIGFRALGFGRLGAFTGNVLSELMFSSCYGILGFSNA